MNKTMFLAALLIFSLTNCSPTNRLKNCKFHTTVEEYAKQVKKEYGVDLTLYGANWAGPDKIFDEKIHLINVGFRIDAQMNIPEGRTLFYKIFDGLINVFNTKKEFQEWFYHYPVGYEDLCVRLSFDYERKGHLKKGNVGMISILNNKITYFTVEADGVTLDLVMRPVVPGVFMGGGFSSRVHAVTKPLPEAEVIESHETPK